MGALGCERGGDELARSSPAQATATPQLLPSRHTAEATKGLMGTSRRPVPRACLPGEGVRRRDSTRPTAADDVLQTYYPGQGFPRRIGNRVRT
jgi:hypothetical protein